MTGDFETTVYGWFCGLVLSLLLCIPDWPMYNTKKVKWLGSIPPTPKTARKGSLAK
jgi:hypothetical protein